MIATESRSTTIPYNPLLGARLQEFVRFSEVKRLLYKVIDLQQERRPDFRSLAVLSLLPGEGKTLFCAALALAYAETCRSKILVVDATSFHHSKSLVLKQCLDPNNAQIDFVSLAEDRNGTLGTKSVSPGFSDRRELAVGMEHDANGDFPVAMVMASEHSLIRRVAKDRSKQYGLVLLDTAPLTAKNKNNLDPFLVARLSDASVLIAGRDLLDSRLLNERLQLLRDPALHLMGVVSNEAHSR